MYPSTQDLRPHAGLDYFSISIEDLFEFHQEELPGLRFHHADRIAEELTAEVIDRRKRKRAKRTV